METEEEESPVKLQVPVKRRKITVNPSQCFICGKGGMLRDPGDQGKSSFVKALLVRKNCGKYDKRDFVHIIDFGNHCFYDEVTNNVRWHKQCYSSYASKSNIQYFIDSETVENVCSVSTSATSTSSCTRSKVDTAIDFTTVCMFCEKAKHKGNKRMIRVEYEKFWTTLESVCDKKEDNYLCLKIGGDFSKLPALEARYHKECHSAYTKETFQKKYIDPSAYENAFEIFRTDFEKQILIEKRAVSMDKLLKKYRYCLIQCELMEEEAEKYEAKRLKRRIEQYYGDKVVFADQRMNKNLPQIVYDKNIDIADAIQTAQSYKIMFSEESLGTLTDNVREEIREDDNARILYYTSLILKQEIQASSGIETQPLSPNDITMDAMIKIVPNRLLQFLQWVCGESESKKLKVLAIGQSMIYTQSNGTKMMPKQVGIGMAIKSALRSKEYLTMLNRHADSISYHETLAIEAYWANQLLSQGDEYATVPINIVNGVLRPSSNR